MKQLDTNRASEYDSLIEVGICLLAIDRILGNDTNEPATNNDNNTTTTSKKKTLKQVYFKWIMDYHSFNDIQITDSEYDQFSGAVKEFLDKQYDDKTNKEIYTLQSLKYSTPAIPKQPNEKPKQLSNDQKIQNKIFVRCIYTLWRRVGKELDDRVSEV